MKEKYSIVISERQAVPRSKRMREAGQSPSSAAVLVSGTGGGNSSCDGHAHTNLPALERIGFDENDDLYLTARVGSVDDETGELTITHEKVKAGYADQAGVAHDLDKDSPANERFLRKDQADGTDFLLEANGGLVVRKQEIVEATLMSITEEGEDTLVEEIKTSSIGAATLGELDNVADSADEVSDTNDILIRLAGTQEWSINTTLFSQVTQLMTKVFPFTMNLSGGGTYEKGSVQIINLSWTYDRDIETQSVNNESLSIDIRTKQYTDVTTDTTYTLRAVSGGETYTKSVSAQFKVKKYYGVSEKEALTNEEILTLSSEWAQNSQDSIQFDCTGGKYPFYILPTSMVSGIQFWIGGLRNTDWIEEIRDVTNTSGYTESYTIFRLNSTQTGVLNIEVR